MERNRIIPADPLDFIRSCVRRRSVLWTYHVNMRMKGRSLSREIILASESAYEIIESYPGDKYLPSYLVCSRHQNVVFHVLFAADVESDNVRIITAYHPGPAHWDANLKTRRKP